MFLFSSNQDNVCSPKITFEEVIKLDFCCSILTLGVQLFDVLTPSLLIIRQCILILKEKVEFDFFIYLNSFSFRPLIYFNSILRSQLDCKVCHRHTLELFTVI